MEGTQVKIGKEQAKEYSGKLDIFKLAGADEICPGVLTKLAEAVLEPLPIIFEK